MRDSGGYNKVPFGPHGDGCECGQEHLHEESQEEVEVEVGEKYTPAEVELGKLRTLVSIIFTQSADALAEHLTAAFEQCGVVGQPLTGFQMKHMIAAHMRGFAQSHAGAMHAAEMFHEMEQRRKAAVEEQKNQVRVGSLKDILDGS